MKKLWLSYSSFKNPLNLSESRLWLFQKWFWIGLPLCSLLHFDTLFMPQVLFNLETQLEWSENYKAMWTWFYFGKRVRCAISKYFTVEDKILVLSSTEFVPWTLGTVILNTKQYWTVIISFKATEHWFYSWTDNFYLKLILKM